MKKHFLSSWEDLTPAFRNQIVMLLLNYDGALVPTSAKNGPSKLSQSTKKILKTLTSLEGVKTGVVSSRPLAELKRLVGVSKLIYVASQGFELEDPAGQFIHPHSANAKKLMKKVWERLKQTLKPFTGVSVDNKIFMLNVKYRQLSKEKINQTRAVFFKTVRPYLSSSKVIVKEGKDAWEVRPVARWNKGTTLVWLYGKVLAQTTERVLPIYFGGDHSDEDAYYSIRPVGMGVEIGNNLDETSTAKYYLRSTSEVQAFLRRLISLKQSQAKAAQKIQSSRLDEPLVPST